LQELKDRILKGIVTFSKWISSTDSTGNLTEIVISFTDNRDKKLMQNELIIAKNLAEAANKAKSNFLTMSHETVRPME
jgi:hypothetical protein